MLPLAAAVALAGLSVASLTDLRTREVPDWLNYSLLASGLGIGALYSVILWQPSFFIASLAGMLFFLGLGTLMFYAGQWGGGDSKLLMGMGALIGVDVMAGLQSLPYSDLLAYLTNLVFSGAAYGLSWTAFLALRNWRAVNTAARAELRGMMPMIAVVVLSMLAATAAASPFIAYAGILGSIALLSILIWAFSKAVEKTCMLKWVAPEQLTEGDWIFKDVAVGGEHICGPKDLGIQKHQIARLIELKEKGKIKTVLIKTGIPFVPSFLIAFAVTLLFGNVLAYLV